MKMGDSGKRLRADTITAIAATITAVAALVVTVWDNVQTREYNRLSVVPKLTLVVQRTGAENAVINLRNDGVGPAIMRKIEIRLVSPEGVKTSYASFANAHAALEDHGVQVTGYWDFDAGDALGPDREQIVLKFRSRGLESASSDPVQSLINGLSARISYESIYGDPQEALLNWSVPGG
jgi:hypothetical protein